MTKTKSGTSKKKVKNYYYEISKGTKPINIPK